jgi:ribonuclease-3
MPTIAKLIARLGFVFNDTRLLEGALSHSSYANEHPDRTYGLPDSERLEFLGDSIINYLAADMLYRRFSDRNEGDLTEFRAGLIKTATLADFARELDLGAYIRVNKGEEASGARNRNALLADTFEALLAAIYLDRGLDAARDFVAPLFERQIEQILTHGWDTNFKTQLQAYIQGTYSITPTYRVAAVEGPEHKRDFTVEVFMGETRIGSGRGPSKQAASQAAAQAALEQLKNTTSTPPNEQTDTAT